MSGRILHGDCREQLATFTDASIDAIVTDPPYELGFMGKKWDASGIAYDPQVWGECLRVLKPGGHLLAFGGTRTYHRMTVAIEDAGFEIRDSLHWLYGSGFPKSLDVSKAIDKAAGAEREIIGHSTLHGGGTGSGASWNVAPEVPNLTAPATDAAQQWNGWGTALKPAHEPIVLARKPLTGTVAANVMEYGTGALNIDATRVGTTDTTTRHNSSSSYMTGTIGSVQPVVTQYTTGSTSGRWPANLVLTHSPECATECVPECPVAILNGQSGITRDSVVVNRNGGDQSRQGYDGGWKKEPGPDQTYGGSGGASRFFTTTTWDPEIDVPFFYVAKPSRRERNAGLDGMPHVVAKRTLSGGADTRGRPVPVNQNTHPTVKPVALMRHLVRLVTPPGGTVLDPFLGSGTTAVAATLEGFDWIGCELTPDYLPIIEARVAWAEAQTPDPIQPELFA